MFNSKSRRIEELERELSDASERSALQDKQIADLSEAKVALEKEKLNLELALQEARRDLMTLRDDTEKRLSLAEELHAHSSAKIDELERQNRMLRRESDLLRSERNDYKAMLDARYETSAHAIEPIDFGALGRNRRKNYTDVTNRSRAESSVELSLTPPDDPFGDDLPHHSDLSDTLPGDPHADDLHSTDRFNP